MNQYETVFILNPVLSDEQIKEAVKKYEDFLTSKGADIVNKVGLFHRRKEKWFLSTFRIQG